MPTIPEKMKAVVTHGPHDYRFEEVPVPDTGEDDVLVKVEGCGICAGDIKAYQGGEVFWGSDGTAPYLETPAIGGHEFIGTVVRIGARAATARDLALGDRVAVEQIAPCGKCLYCQRGLYSLCAKHDVFGFKYYLNGGFAEYANLPKEARVYKISRDLPLTTAVLIEPYACSYHAVERARVTEEDVLVISGCGPLGLGMVAAARNKNPKKLIALDLFDERLRHALAFGADEVINARETDAVQAILAQTGGYGCDAYIEATGHAASVLQGLAAIRKGGRFVEFSVFNDSVTLNWTLIGDAKELDIYGVSLSPNCFEPVIADITSGKLNTSGIVTHTFPLERFKEAFDVCQNARQGVKVMLSEP
jgi:threonine dehydrogenase-like Zn-dependent dehydrogenase